MAFIVLRLEVAGKVVILFSPVPCGGHLHKQHLIRQCALIRAGLAGIAGDCPPFSPFFRRERSKADLTPFSFDPFLIPVPEFAYLFLITTKAQLE